LRKARFRSQTFEDIAVEREVDIRRRVAKVLVSKFDYSIATTNASSRFNKREDDFETLKDYNDYLETVEEMTWNLINRIDVEETERRLQAFAEQNKQEIAQNAATSKQEAQARRARESEEAERAKLRKAEAQQKEVREAQEKETARRTALDNLADGTAEEGQRVVLKKSSAQRKIARDDPFSSGTETSDTAFTFKGLKKRTAPEPEKPYDAFDGWSMEPQYFVLQDSYNVDWVKPTQKDMLRHTGGGQNMKDFYTRALVDAFAGFGVFVEDEKAERDGNSDTKTASVAAAIAAGGDVAMDDVF
jgi:CDK-activating kinase assembly factor MAT1